MTTPNATTQQDGEVLTPIIHPEGKQEEKTQKDYYQKASHYDVVWGQDNIHFGFYPHLDVHTKYFLHPDQQQQRTSLLEEETKQATPHLHQSEASTLLTRRIMDLAGITQGMRVVDLGSGKGRVCREIAQVTGAACVGLDNTPAYVQRAQEMHRHECPHLDLDFVQGSFTN